MDKRTVEVKGSNGAYYKVGVISFGSENGSTF